MAACYANTLEGIISMAIWKRFFCYKLGSGGREGHRTPGKKITQPELWNPAPFCLPNISGVSDLWQILGHIPNASSSQRCERIFSFLSAIMQREYGELRFLQPVCLKF
jgi:hypothetical protein